MKKKVLSFVMAAVLAVVLGACGGQKDPKTVYTEALDKMASLTSYDMDGSIDMTLESEGESMTLTVGVAGQVSGANTEAMQMAVTESIGMDELGLNMDVNVYYKDGTIYMGMFGQKVKYAASVDEAAQELAQIQGSGTDVELLKDLTAEKTDEGTKLTFTADGADMSSYMTEALSQAESLMNLSDADITFGDATGELIVNQDGYVASQKMDMDMTLNVEGTSMNMSMAVNMNYNNPGQEVTVEFPEDLDSYQEMETPAE